MAHHVGMGLVALAGALAASGGSGASTRTPWCARPSCCCTSDCRAGWCCRSRSPRAPTRRFPIPSVERPAVRDIATADTPQPRVALLGQLPYTIMVTNAGAGYSRYEELAVTRWRADGTRDHLGQFCYVKDITAGTAWSATHQPMCAPADRYRALLATDRVTFERVDGEIETRTEIAVVPADAGRSAARDRHQSRRTTTREIEVTSYGEIVLAPPDADRAHPAFANLFVETEWHEWCTAVTATRRPRSADERALWLVHVVADGQGTGGPVSCETDRARFRRPRAIDAEPIALGCRRRAERHHRRRARPDLRASGAGPPPARPVRDGGLHHAGAPRPPRPRLRARRAATTIRMRRQRALRSRLDLHAGGAARAQPDPGRRRGLPGAGRPSLLLVSRPPGPGG